MAEECRNFKEKEEKQLSGGFAADTENSRLNYEKLRLYENLLLYSLLQDLAASSDQLPFQVKKCLSDLLSIQECNCLRKSVLQCFSFNQTFDSYPKRTNFKSILQKAVIEKLNSYKSRITECLQDTDFSDDWRQLEKLTNSINELEHKIHILRHDLYPLLCEYKEQLDQFFELADTYSAKIFNSETKAYANFAEWMNVVTDALNLKAKLIQMKQQEETFTVDCVKKLKKINFDYDTELHLLTAKSKEKKTLLKSYASMSGPQFKKLVEQYENLEKELENKRWALKEFGQTPNNIDSIRRRSQITNNDSSSNVK